METNQPMKRQPLRVEKAVKEVQAGYAAFCRKREMKVGWRRGKNNKMKHSICPTCRQDMNEEPQEGVNGKDCPQCGQGLSWRKAARSRKGKP